MIDEIKHLIKAKKYTCIAADDKSIVYQALGKGVQPIISPMRKNVDFFKNKYIADTKIGRAAALLFALSGAKYVYGEVMSETAITILQENNIEFEYDILVPFTVNREGTGMCPLEECIKGESNPKIAYKKIETKILELMNSNK